MEYIVNLYSNDERISGVAFNTKEETSLYIGTIITNTLSPIKVETNEEINEGIFVENDADILKAMIFNIYIDE